MAGLSKRPKSDYWYVFFRFGGRAFSKSLRTTKQDEAERIAAGIEQTLLDIERGRLTVPSGADFWQFVFTDGKLKHKLQVERDFTASDLFTAYFEKQTEGAKEENTIQTEHLHE